MAYMHMDPHQVGHTHIPPGQHAYSSADGYPPLSSTQMLTGSQSSFQQPDQAVPAFFPQQGQQQFPDNRPPWEGDNSQAMLHDSDMFSSSLADIPELPEDFFRIFEQGEPQQQQQQPQQLPAQLFQPSLMDLVNSDVNPANHPQAPTPARISSPAFPNNFLGSFGLDNLHAHPANQFNSDAHRFQNSWPGLPDQMHAQPGAVTRQLDIPATFFDGMDIDGVQAGGGRTPKQHPPASSQSTRIESPDILNDFFASLDVDAMPHAELPGPVRTQAPARVDSPDLLDAFFSSHDVDDIRM